MDEFADRLNALYRAFPRPDDDPRDDGSHEWRDIEVARAGAADRPDVPKPVLSRQYLDMLRTGKRKSPSLPVTSAIAVAFAELTRRTGTPVGVPAILSYLAGHHPVLAGRRADPRYVHDVLVAEAETLEAGAADPSGRVAISARLGGDSAPLADIEQLIDRLSCQEAGPLRLRLARLLRMRPQTSSDSEPDD